MSNVLLYAITVAIWGSTWLAITFQLGEVAPEVSLAYRYALASAMLFAWCLVLRRSLRFGLREHALFAALGLFLFGLNYIATYRAQLYITSALNAVAFSSLVWMNILNARLFFGTRSEARVYIGAALGMAGIVVLFWPQIEDVSLTDATLVGAAFCLTGVVISSLGNVVAQHTQRRRLPVLQANAWGMLYGAILTATIAFSQGHAFDFDTSPSYVISLVYLALFGSVIAFGTYLTLLGRIGVHKAGYSVVMFPVVAIVLSVLFEGLTVTPYILAGVVLVLVGNTVILSRGPAERRALSPEPALSPARPDA